MPVSARPTALMVPDRRLALRVLHALVVCLVLFSASRVMAVEYDPARSGVLVRMGDQSSEYTLMSFFSLAGRFWDIHVTRDGEAVPFTLKVGDTVLARQAANHRYKVAPAIGHVDLTLLADGARPVTLRVFTLRPATETVKGVLNGYRIGEYPKERYRNQAIYDPPVGFVEVTERNVNLAVSPHYRLGQFVSKQSGGYPKYLVLQTQLLRKLEYLTELMNEKGYRTNGFHIMSGYRTPFYNKQIKNKLYSRHQWGGAADIFIDDSPRDNYMDDINRDGKRDVEDVKVMAALIEEKFDKADYRQYIGGLGIYKKNAVRGPFIHVDVRGSKARW